MEQQKSLGKTLSKRRNLKAPNDLEKLVGTEIYSVWIKMLKTIAPHGRTHRLAVVVAGMLHYALEQTNLKQNLDNPLGEILEEAIDSGDYFSDKIIEIVEMLFKDAGVKCKRKNCRGEVYSIAETSVQEFFVWYNMPWE